VAQQVPGRHAAGEVGVGDPEVRQVLHDGCVEVEQPFVDETHHQRRRPHLGHRTDLEDRVGGRLDPSLEVEHAGRGAGDAVGHQHGGLGARHVELAGERLQRPVEVLLH